MDPYPEKAMFYNKPKVQKFKNTVIKNANKVVPKANDKETFICDNTTPIDSIFNIFVNTFHNYSTFYDFCNEENTKKNLFFETLVEYAGKGNFSAYYKNRISFLKNIGHVVNHTISCKENVGIYLHKLLGNIYSLKRILHCKKCNWNQFSTHATILPLIEISKEILQNKDFIKYFLTQNNNQFICGKCKNILEIHYEIKKFLIIDIEQQNLRLDIFKLPETIVFENKNFVLSGVIEYELFDSGHKKYVAFCRSVGGFWSRKDEKKKFNSIFKHGADLLVAMIIYVNKPNLFMMLKEFKIKKYLSLNICT